MKTSADPAGRRPLMRPDAVLLGMVIVDYALAGQTIQSAKLRMFVINASPGVQSVKNVSDNGWTETGLTWSNRPSKGSTVVTFTSGSSTSVGREADMTSAAAGKAGQLMSLAIDTTNTDAYQFNSGNASTNPVALVVDFGGTPAPTAPPTQRILTSSATGRTTISDSQLTFSPMAPRHTSRT